MSRKNNIRKGCKDIWNAFMCEGADFTSHSKNDIPFCPTTATEMPKAIITWCEAKRLYRNALARKDKLFFCNAFVCWFIDDYKFDGPRGVWHDCTFVLKVLRHFAGRLRLTFPLIKIFLNHSKLIIFSECVRLVIGWAKMALQKWHCCYQ